MSRYRFHLSSLAAALSVLAPVSVRAQTFTERLREGAGSAAKTAQLDGKSDLVTIIGNIINVAIGFVGIVLFCYFLYAGFLYLTAQDNKDNITKAKSIMKNSIIGLVIILLSYAIVNFIFTDITPMIAK